MQVELTSVRGGGVTPELYQGMRRDSWAMNLVKGMGWKEGEGIGANGDGMTTHIHVKKRREGTGIGADVTEHSKFNWTVNTEAFDAVLAGLNEIHGSSSDDERDDKKATKQKKKKKAKKEREAKQAEQQKKSDKKEKDKKGAARCLPQGRYAKRELNKNVKGYSAKDLGAILGVVVPGGDAWGSVAAEEEEELQVESEEEEKAEKARKAEATRKKRCLIVIEAPELEAEKLTAEKQAKLDEFFRLAPDWWGAKVFRSSGRLGDIKKTDEAEDGAEVKRGFEEADQERLYNATHAGATSGKQGLGIADRTKKVAGARWGGTKKAFVEEEHTEAQEEGGAGRGEGAKAVKWKKYAEQALGEAKGGRLSIKKLLKRVSSLVGLNKGDEDVMDARRLDMLTKLKGSSRFVVDAEAVVLAAEEGGMEAKKAKRAGGDEEGQGSSKKVKRAV